MILDRIKRLEAARAAQQIFGIASMTEAEIDAELAAAFGAEFDARSQAFFEAVQRGDLVACRAMDTYRSTASTESVRKMSEADLDSELARFKALVNTRFAVNEFSALA